MFDILFCMSGKSKIVVEDHLSMDEINKFIKDLKMELKLYKRLLFLKSVKQGNTISYSAKFVGISRGTGFRWLNDYNEHGLEGLIPKYAGGRPSFLNENQLNELKSILSDPTKNYSISDAHKIIKEKYNVDYSYKQVWEIVRKKLNLNYSKPFPIYENKPDNPKEALKKTYEIDLENEYLAFLDSVGFQNIPNSLRTIHPPLTKNKITKYPIKIKINGTGLQGVNCNSYLEFSKSTKAHEFSKILIKNENSEYGR